jgi:hypothetical protein
MKECMRSFLDKLIGTLLSVRRNSVVYRCDDLFFKGTNQKVMFNILITHFNILFCPMQWCNCILSLVVLTCHLDL